MVQGDLIYPKATSRIITMTKPTISPRVAIITPAAKPIMMSNSFRLICLKKKTMADPTMVQLHVNNPARKACKTTDCDWNQFITTPIFLLIHLFYSTISIRMKEGLSKKREWDRNRSFVRIRFRRPTSAQLSRAVKADEISVVEPTQPLRLARQSKDNWEARTFFPLSSSHIVQLDNLLDLDAPFLLSQVGPGATQ